MALLGDEFERFQTQLLDLKTEKYSLEEDGRRKDREIGLLKQKLEEMDKELSRTQNLAKLNPLSFAKSLANKKQESKEAAQIEQLNLDHGNLQRKIESQEEEFQITNQTLREEITSLMASNKKLLKEINLLKGLPEDHIPEEAVVSRSSGDGQEGPAEADIGMGNYSNQRHLSYAFLAEKETLSTRIFELNAQVSELLEQKDSLSSRVGHLEQIEVQFNQIKAQLDETIALAEKRKSSVDEMKKAIDEQKENFTSESRKFESEHQTQISELKATKDRRISELEALIVDLRLEVSSLKASQGGLKKEVFELSKHQEMLAASEERCRELQEQLEVVELRLEATEQDRESKLAEVESGKEMAALLMVETHECELKELQKQLFERDEQIHELRSDVVKLRQDIKDGIEERKIHEKKAMMIVKELKRSMGAEKKRADKLQDKLKEFLNENIPSELNSPNSKNTSLANHETSSVGSWSYVDQSGGRPRTAGSTVSDSENHRLSHNNVISCPNSPNASGDHVHVSEQSSLKLLEQENSQLVTRLTQLQQEKWSLEEKVNHLEVAKESLAGEVASKTKLIEFYCMEGRSDPSHHGSPLHGDKLTVKRVVDFIKDKGDENAKEINRKLQRMLEETLTKNMHLQRDLERLSTEVLELRKASS